VKVQISAVAPDATINEQHFTIAGQVWHEGSKLPLSGAEQPVVVDIDATQ
jgi:hypothetical protein